MYRTPQQQFAINRKQQETRDIRTMGGGAEVAGAILSKAADDDKKRYDNFVNAHGIHVTDEDLPENLRANWNPEEGCLESNSVCGRCGREAVGVRSLCCDAIVITPYLFKKTGGKQYAEEQIARGANPDNCAELNYAEDDAPVSDYPKQINLDGSEPHQLSEAQTAKTFILAGNAYFTVRSLKSGVRYTYRVSKAKPNPGYERTGTQTYFVSLLTGPENTSDYSYLGMIRDGRFSLTRASKMNTGSTPVKAFEWVWRHLSINQMPPQTEIWHEGRCGRCGRTLTVPESIAAGIGPECAGKI